jgi:ketosteroid isomerase-like protein
MGVAENLDIVRRVYAAFSNGDADTLRSLFSEDPVHSVPGSSPISGDHKGVDNILKMYGDLAARSDGTIRSDLEDVLSDGAHQVITVHTSTASRADQSLNQREALLFTIDHGKVTSIKAFFSDIDAEDRFWGG